MNPQLLTVVEQFWHKAPGGTATATERTLAHVAELQEFRITGVAARHPPPVDTAPRPSTGPEGAATWQRMPAGSTLRFHPLPRPLLYESWLRLGRPSIDRYRRGPAVVWASSLIVPPTSAPVVATVHDLDFLDHPEFLTRRGQRFFPRVWATARTRADLFVCPSQVVADDCARHGASLDRLTVVPWGVEPPRCDEAEAAELVARLGLPDRYVLWVGPTEPRKNPVVAAEAMERLDDRDLGLVVVGARTAHAEGAAFDRLGARVHRRPWVDNRTLSALYRRAAVLLYPSVAEGFGLPVLEAMAHGTPVVTSASTATAEVAGGAALTVDPRDAAEMADALAEALTDSATRRRLVEDGLTRAGELSWDATAKGYAEAFRSVL